LRPRSRYVAFARNGCAAVHVGLAAPLTLTTTSLAVQAVPGTRMVVYRPADEITREAIGKLLAGEGAGARYPCWAEHQRRKAGLAS